MSNPTLDDQNPDELIETEEQVSSEITANPSSDPDMGIEQEPEEATKKVINDSLVDLGFVNFDNGVSDNNTTGALVSEEKRKQFRRDVYVGIKDEEQGKEFLGRIVEGPFYAPHEIGADSAITRTTVLHPERTKFRPSYYVSGTIEVLGELMEGERVIVTPTRPRPYSQIYIFPNDRLSQLLEINGSFYLGQLMGYTKIKVNTKVDNKNFIPRNIGIFGTVGSGKSNTTQVLMEEATAAGWAVVVVDVEGEYVCMNEPTENPDMIALHKEYDLKAEGIKDFTVYVPSAGHSEADDPKSFKVPVSKIDIDMLADILELNEPQVRMLGKMIEEIGKKKGQPVNRLGVFGDVNESKDNPYTLSDLIEAFTPGQDGKFALYPTMPSTEKSTAYALLGKLYRIGRSGMLDWDKTQSVPELPVKDLIVGGRLSVLDVSETDDRSRNIAIAYVLQALFEQVIQTPVGEKMPSGGVRPKVLLVIEEVHTFVSKSSVQKMRAVLDNLQIVSRRGRKRWMGLALVSQQPSHVPDELFELTNTRFIHQLKSVANLDPVKRTTGGVHEALWSNIPALGPGQCLITGAVFKTPLFVNMRPAKSKRLLTS